MTVTYGYKEGQEGIHDIEFYVSALSSLEEITNKAFDLAWKVEHVNGNVVVDCPVYLKDSIRDKEEHIGYIRITTRKDNVGVEHLTLEKKVLNHNWNVIGFYHGLHGLKDD